MLKINKTRARKLYNQGKTIYFTPCKCNVHSMFTYNTDKKTCQQEFDNLVNEFEYYNCNYELGYYSHYYIND